MLTDKKIKEIMIKNLCVYKDDRGFIKTLGIRLPEKIAIDMYSFHFSPINYDHVVFYDRPYGGVNGYCGNEPSYYVKFFNIINDPEIHKQIPDLFCATFINKLRKALQKNPEIAVE